MDPISGIIAAAGIATSIFGGSKSASGAKMQYQAQLQEAQLEQQADAQRRQAMELDANRKNMEVLRNSQRARSQALENATSQGAQFGSGLQGGYGQVSGQSNTNLLGIGQDLKIGENLFDINGQINQQKMLYAQGGQMVNEGNAISSIGKTISGSAGTLAGFGQTAFASFGGGGPGGKGIG